MPDTKTSWIKDYALIILTVLCFALPGLTTLPSMDRDESRYAQASSQMLETGDYVNIRFQDEARNKKPAGAYWAQTASVALFSEESRRQIWAHRIPSVIAAIIAALLTFWAGRILVGRTPAFYGTILLSMSFIFAMEAKTAKTDSLLLAATMLSIGALAHMRRKTARKYGILFWVGMGLAVMIKGPLGPAVAAMLILTLVLWERRANWLKPLGYWPGPVIFALLVMPWMIAIWQATGGEFFKEAIGQDFAPKLASGQESHGGPVGYYLGTIWAFFWPGALFLLPGFAFAIRATGQPRSILNFAILCIIPTVIAVILGSVTGLTFIPFIVLVLTFALAMWKMPASDMTPIPMAARFLLAWAVPVWILMEVVPTKLPHYPLMIYPALALMGGVALSTMMQVSEFKVTRIIGGLIFLVISFILAMALPGLQAGYGPVPSWSFVPMGLIIVLALLVFIRMIRGEMKTVLPLTFALTFIWTVSGFLGVIPSLKPLKMAQELRQEYARLDLVRPADGGPVLHSPTFTEPSLVFEMGTDVSLANVEAALDPGHMARGDLVLLNRLNPEDNQTERLYLDIAEANSMCPRVLWLFDGLNYVKSDAVKLALMKAEPCLDVEDLSGSGE